MLLASQSLLTAAEELSLARSPEEFGESLEHLADQVAGRPGARFHQLDSEGQVLRRAGETVPVTEDSLPGRCALYSEAVPGALPVRRYGAVVGVLEVPDGDPTALADLARLAGLLWEKVTLREDLSAFATRTEEVLIRAAEAVDPGAEAHVLRVSRLASELAAWMDLSAQSRRLVDRAARFHDVGKVMLAHVSRAERERLHPGAGADYLRATRVLADLAPVVEAHHERYHECSHRDEVPIEAWVLALAEHLDESRQEGDFEAWLERAARVHHPEVMDALGGLVVSGRLKELLHG